MRKTSLLLFLVAIANLQTSCKKEEEIAAADNTSAKVAACEPGAFSNANHTYSIGMGGYKGLNKITLIRDYDKQKSLNVAEMQYEYANNDEKVTRINYIDLSNNKAITGYNVYEYNNKGYMIKQLYYEKVSTGDILTESITYEYDAANKITKISEYDGSNKLEGYEVIDGYDTNGNLMKITRYNFGGTLRNSTEYEYNDKFNPKYALGGFLSGFDIEESSKNAVVKRTDKNAAGVVSRTITYTYSQYNDKNFPAEVTISRSDEADTETVTYKFNCR